jgi:putative peptidoglycan lipid II flippase
LVGIAARVAPAALLVQVLSLGSSIALATQLGATDQTDAYYLALSVPTIAFGVLIAALRLGAIPTLANVAHAESPEHFSRACDEVASATLALGIGLAVLTTTVMIALVPTVVGGSAHLISLTRQFVLELSPYAVTGAMLGVLGAILAVRGRFVAATIVLGFEPVLKSALVLAFGRQLGAQTLIIGNLAGNLLAVATLWDLLRREGLTVRLAAFHASPVVRGLLALSGPLVISQSLLSTNPLVDRFTAASLGPGSVTVFELGVRLFSVPTSLLTGMFIAPLAATWTTRFAQRGWDAVLQSFIRVVVAVFLIVPPLIILGFVLRHELVGIVYGAGRYSAADVRHTSNVLGILLLGLVAQILVIPLATLFIVRRDTVFPMLVGIANFLLNAILDVLLRGPLGVNGIALSTTLTLTLLCGVFAWEARRRWGSLGFHRSLSTPLLVSACSCAVIALTSTLAVRIASPESSRLQAVAVVVVAASVGLVVHATALTIGRAPIRTALPMLPTLPGAAFLRRRRT